MKKWSVLFLIAIVLLSSCGNNNSAKNHESNSEKSVVATISPTPTPKVTQKPASTPKSTPKPTQTPEELCHSGCGKEGTNVCLGGLGERFWFCDEHYKENSYRYNHPCEECRHIGKYKVRNPISGAVEYYCEEHYKKIIEAVDSMSRY